VSLEFGHLGSRQLAVGKGMELLAVHGHVDHEEAFHSP
jgi:hypothetical protein